VGGCSGHSAFVRTGYEVVLHWGASKVDKNAELKLTNHAIPITLNKVAVFERFSAYPCRVLLRLDDDHVVDNNVHNPTRHRNLLMNSISEITQFRCESIFVGFFQMPAAKISMYLLRAMQDVLIYLA